MSDVRLGDVIDDFCVKCKRLTNHAIVSIMNGAAAKVRCRTCYSDHDYRNEIPPLSKRDLKKAALFNQVLSSVAPSPAPAAASTGDSAPLNQAPPVNQVGDPPLASKTKTARKKT